MSPSASVPRIDPVLAFLRCRTPAAWTDNAIADLDTLLADHASLELKAAQQAQKLIRKYGGARPGRHARLSDSFRSRLVHRMSRLAREELRHFEQVVTLIERGGHRYVSLSPSRYAASLHAVARRSEPDALVDALIIGAVIEARSCERLFSLIAPPGQLDEVTEKFYVSLLRSEARHFEDYLELARGVGSADLEDRIELFLEQDAELVSSRDPVFRFLSGVPVATTNPAKNSV